MAKDAIRVLVTGAAGKIGYALVPMIAKGLMIGEDQPIVLHMLDTESAAPSIQGLKMELIDASYPLLQGVVTASDNVEGCKGVNIATMVGDFPCKEGILPINVPIFRAQELALDHHAAPNCKVLMVDNPANTNALFLKQFFPSIPSKNITRLTRLDHNPYANLTTVATSVSRLTGDDNWLDYEYVPSTHRRGSTISEHPKLSSVLSVASATCDHIHDWVFGTAEGTWISIGVCSNGSYGIERGLINYFPVTCQNGEGSIVHGVSNNELPKGRRNLKKHSMHCLVLSANNTILYVLFSCFHIGKTKFISSVTFYIKM